MWSHPLAIANWVRNNVEWVPTWGAIQSADDTLAKRRGNAHDIASLTIALLRASDIPARYQYGTIELDAEQMNNWVGGVTVPEAALQLLGQGGIANRGIANAGRIGKVQMEHVWVSAFVNWAPSRGSRQGTPTQHVNPVGPHNAWTALDASYKQYSYTAGYDLKTAVPLDANQLLNAAQQGATVNAAEGWVQNLNQAAIQSQLTDYQARLKTYIDSRNPSATVGEVIGRKIIPVEQPSLIAGSLPYTVTLQGQQVSAIPNSLQHRFTYKRSTSRVRRAWCRRTSPAAIQPPHRTAAHWSQTCSRSVLHFLCLGRRSVPRPRTTALRCDRDPRLACRRGDAVLGPEAPDVRQLDPATPASDSRRNQLDL
jgi:hypothetical protein